MQSEILSRFDSLTHELHYEPPAVRSGRPGEAEEETGDILIVLVKIISGS